MRIHLPKGPNQQYDAVSKEQYFRVEMLFHPQAMLIRIQPRNGGSSIDRLR